jgi:hypothetical protein
MSLHKGGDPSQLDNYRPISKRSALANVLENLVNSHVKDFLYNNSVLSQFQSGFRAKHSTFTAVSKVVGDILDAQDKKNHCFTFLLTYQRPSTLLTISCCID